MLKVFKIILVWIEINLNGIEGLEDFKFKCNVFLMVYYEIG